jgi:hypothetical protein
MPQINKHIGALVVAPSTSLPKYGVGPFGISTANDVDTYLTQTMPDQETGEFTLSCEPSEFLYFMSPRAIGSVTFTDTVSGIQGGWDGASWPEGSNEGKGSGHVPITYQNEQWYLYRTDFGEQTSMTYQVSYQDPITTPIKPASMVITHGATVAESHAATFPVEVTYDDASTALLSPSAGNWESDNAALTFSSTGFTTAAISEDTEVNVSFTYFEQGVTLTDAFTITVNDTPPPLTVSRFVGASTSAEGQDVVTYTPEVRTNDTANTIVEGSVFTWTVTPSAGVIIDQALGEITYPDVTSATDYTVGIEFTYEGVQQFHELTINVDVKSSLPPILAGVGLFGSNAATLDGLVLQGENRNPTTIALNNNTAEEYGYIACRSSDFSELTGTDGNFQVSWDGASWPEDDVGDDVGPVQITYQGVLWYIWRTDFSENDTTFYMTLSE